MPFTSIRRKILFGVSALTLLFGLAMVVFTQTIIRRTLVEHAPGDRCRDRAKGRLRLRQPGDHRTVLRSDDDAQGPARPRTRTSSTASWSTRRGTTSPTPSQGAFRRVSRTRTRRTRSGHAFGSCPPTRGPVLDIGVPLLRGQIGRLHLGLSLTAIRRDVNEIVLLIAVPSGSSLLLAGIAVVGRLRARHHPAASARSPGPPRPSVAARRSSRSRSPPTTRSASWRASSTR